MIIKTERAACGRKIHRVFSHLPLPPRPSQEFPPSPSLPPDFSELRNPYLSPAALSSVSDAGRSAFENPSQVDFCGFEALEAGRRQSRAGDGNPAHPSLGMSPFSSPITTLEICAGQHWATLFTHMMVSSSQALPAEFQGIFWWDRHGMVWVGRYLKLISFQGRGTSH